MLSFTLNLLAFKNNITFHLPLWKMLGDYLGHLFQVSYFP